MESSLPYQRRPVLGDLPAIALTQRPRPSAIDSSVPEFHAIKNLTPPSTPSKDENSPNLQGENGDFANLPNGASSYARSADASENVINDKPGSFDIGSRKSLKLYHKTYQLHEELGRGAWSTVYKASDFTESLLLPDTIPPSPPISPSKYSAHGVRRIIAVKRPSRRDAYPILEKEALILTYLHTDIKASAFLVPFHGFCSPDHSLVLDAVPQNLEAHVRAARQRLFSTKTMFDPIIGGAEWFDVAQCLIDGLTFLHDHRCIHGDIKPANILLRQDQTGSFIPLYCDFSSSRIQSPDASPKTSEEVSAVTTDYTSPELLEALHKRNDAVAVTTFASDIFALAVTLLFTATGESPYASARIEYQRLAMAKEGIPLEYANRGDQASRVMGGKAVERALALALNKDPRERCESRVWRGEVARVSHDYITMGP